MYYIKVENSIHLLLEMQPYAYILLQIKKDKLVEENKLLQEQLSHKEQHQQQQQQQGEVRNSNDDDYKEEIETLKIVIEEYTGELQDVNEKYEAKCRHMEDLQAMAGGMC